MQLSRSEPCFQCELLLKTVLSFQRSTTAKILSEQIALNVLAFIPKQSQVQGCQIYVLPGDQIYSRNEPTSKTRGQNRVNRFFQIYQQLQSHMNPYLAIY